jgi:hypothetical protein
VKIELKKSGGLPAIYLTALRIFNLRRLESFSINSTISARCFDES